MVRHYGRALFFEKVKRQENSEKNIRPTPNIL